MSNSTNLGLLFLQSGQAQKHVTLNESLLRLDAIVQLAAVSATSTTQPSSPADGELYILPPGKTGAAWGAMADGALAYHRDGVWEEITPRAGFVAYVKDTDVLLTYSGSVWGAVTASLGLGTASAKDTGSSGNTVPLLDGANTWSAAQVFYPGTAIGSSGVGILFNNTAADYLHTIDKDNTGVSFAVNSGSRGFRWIVSGSAMAEIEAGGSLRTRAHLPSTDNTYNLGSSSFRFGTVYAATGSINTSDAREKTPVAPLPDSVKRAVRHVLRHVGVYQWLSAIEAKGDADARLHIGVTAQAVYDAFLSEGEDPARWALFCADPLLETIVIEEDAEELAPVLRETESIELTHEVDRVVRKRTTQMAPIIDLTPLVDEAGKPVLKDGVAIMMERPKLEVRHFKRERSETRAVLRQDGEPELRLGVRYDQLMLLALATLAEHTQI